MLGIRILKTTPFLLGILLFSYLSGNAQSYDCEEELFSKKDRKTRLFGYVNAIGEFRIPPVFIKAMPYLGRYAIVQQGNRFGVVNCEGVLVVPADYEEIASFSNGKGWVKKGGLWGLCDTKGRLLVAPLYEEIKEINLYSGSVTWVKKKGQWGLISKENGRMVVNPQYDEISSISDSAGICRKSTSQDLVYYGDGRVIISGMRKVQKFSRNLFAYESSEKQWGAFNSLAFILIRPEWSGIKLNGNLVQIEKEGLYGLRSLKGSEILPVKYSVIQDFTAGFASVKESSKWQIINSNGEFNLPEPNFDFAEVISQKVAIIGKENVFGVWNPLAKTWVLPLSYLSVRPSKDRTWLELHHSSGVVGFDCLNLKLFTETFDSLAVSDPGVQIRGFFGKKIFITSSSKFQKGSGFDSVIPIASGYLICSREGKFGVIRNLDVAVLPFDYSKIEAFYTGSGMVFSVEKDRLSGVVGEKNQILLPLQFQKVLPAKNQLFIASADSKWGIVNSEGSWVTENKFDSILSPIKIQDLIDFPVIAWRKGKSALVGQNGSLLTNTEEGNWFYAGEASWVLRRKMSYTLWNNAGKQIGDLSFDSFLPFSEGNAPVFIQNKWGFINHSGRLVIAARFEEVLPYKSGIAYAKEGGLWGVLKKNGSWLVKPSGKSVEIDEQGKRHLVLP